MEDLLRVGVITTAHGIRGEVNVFPTTDEPEMFQKWEKLILITGKERKSLTLQKARPFKNMMILGFREITDRNQAELLRQAELYITREQAKPCEENENFIVDLIGLKVVDEDGQEIGRCTDVFQTGANDVYEVELTGGGQVLLPAIPSCILKVDVAEGIMMVHVLDGLL